MKRVNKQTEKEFADINSFNIEGRYPEEKLAFHKRATKQFAQHWLTTISQHFIWLTEQFKK